MAKKELITVFILLLISVTFFFVTRDDETQYPQESIYSKVLSKGIVFDDLSKIEIYKGKELPKKLEFFLKGKTWLDKDMFNHKVIKKKLEDIVDSINKLEGEVRSDDIKLVSDYKLTDREAIHILLYKGNEIKPIEHILIGMKGAKWNTAFVRENKSGKVYLCDSNPLIKIGVYSDAVDGKLDSKQFLDKNLLKLSENLTRVEINRKNHQKIVAEYVADEAMAVNKNDTNPVKLKKQWKITTPEHFKSDIVKVKRWTDSLKSIWAQKVLSPKLAKDYSIGTESIILTSEKGVIHTIKIGRRIGNIYPAMVDNEPYLFGISDREYKRYMGNLSELGKAEIPKASVKIGNKKKSTIKNQKTSIKNVTKTSPAKVVNSKKKIIDNEKNPMISGNKKTEIIKKAENVVKKKLKKEKEKVKVDNKVSK